MNQETVGKFQTVAEETPAPNVAARNVAVGVRRRQALPMDSFQSPSVTAGVALGLERQRGQFEARLSLRDTLKIGGAWPISLADQTLTTRTRLEVAQQVG